MYQPGHKIGSYEIVTPLKPGGMASLFLARRVGPAGFRRPVAIKVIHPFLAQDQSFLQMFQEEASLSARIQHPNVVTTEELGQDNGTYYLVMEYVPGCTLGSFLAALGTRRLSTDVVIWIGMKIAEGLHAAHETRDDQGRPLGVVHRDVSPQNVLLSYTGHVKLIDFGVAKARGRSPTAAGQIKGKLRYMSPEQARGRIVDRRSDVFALGILLWEMLTQRRLFSANNDIEALHAVRDPSINSPRSVVPAISHDLDAVVMHALVVDPDKRFQTAQALRRALSSVSPRAFSIDSEDVASLIADVMKDEIAAERAKLPRRVTQDMRWPVAPVRSADSTTPLLAPATSALSSAPASTAAPSTKPSGQSRGRSRSRLSLVVAVAALVTALLGIPAGFLLGVEQGKRVRVPPVAPPTPAAEWDAGTPIQRSGP